MSYTHEPVVHIDIDGKSFFDYDTEYQEQIIQEVNAIIQFLKSKKIQFPSITNNPVYFEDLDNYIGKLIDFDNTLDIFIEDDETLNSFSILELLYVLGILSKRSPSSLISTSIGDGAFFVVELTLKNGNLVGYKTYGTNKEGEEIDDNINIDDLSDEYGFVCSKEEMEEFFNKKIQEL